MARAKANAKTQSRKPRATTRGRSVPATKAKTGRVERGGAGRGRRIVRSANLRARFDNAQTTDENRRHWLGADALSADAAANPGIRRILRDRARYEVANNSYARGMVLTLANDLVGVGPRLQMSSEDVAANVVVEREFARWAKSIGLADKLRVMRMARAQDGEAFGLLVDNQAAGRSVTLDLRLIEADQVGTPTLSLPKPGQVDGIRFDAWGNPTEYHVLKSHPGSPSAGTSLMDFDPVPAADMVHWFRCDRPGQSRGLPDLMPALGLFAQLRRYTEAVLGAAETAADVAGILHTGAPPDGEADEVDPMATFELEKRMLLTAPMGWDMTQVRAEQPSTTYDAFKRAILSEIARCLNMPYNVAACDSSTHNYASGRLDHQLYLRSIVIEQSELETVVLDPIFDAWLAEARCVPGLLPSAVLDDGDPHQWFWQGLAEVDPRWAQAEADQVAGGLMTEAHYQARRGMDYEAVHIQLAREAEGRRALGLPPPGVTPTPKVESEGEMDDDGKPVRPGAKEAARA